MREYLIKAKFLDSENGGDEVEDSIRITVNEDENLARMLINQVGGWSVDMASVGLYFQSFVGYELIEGDK